MLKKMIKAKLPDAVVLTCNALVKAEGEAWLVGGCVRDLLLQSRPKDWDIEVFALEEDRLVQVLESLGRCEKVGKHFGVHKLWLDGIEIDIALPRQERKISEGHRGFDVSCNPNLAPKLASLRRDFTINAMMYNPITRTLLDFHHGQQDLKNKILRHVSSAFVEDPLRPLRAMQFAARFALTLDKNTALLCKEVLPEAGALPASRIWQEWLKWAKADFPSMGLYALRDMGWDILYPELQALQACPQDVYWHPEGDVWVHTCLVVDEARKLCALRDLSEKESIVLIFAALCHDLGKPSTTFTNEKHKIVSPDHGNQGVQPSLDFLNRIGSPKWLSQVVQPLVKEHVAHFSGEPTARAVKRLAQRLLPSNIKLWEVLTEADANGRHPAPPSRPALPWLNLAQSLGVFENKESEIVTGKLLLAWGIQPSPKMGKLLKSAYDAQLEGLFHDEESAKAWLKTIS